MTQEADNSKNNFLYPKQNYHGDFSSGSPNNLIFNANLQEFAQGVMYVCSLETNGKISSESAYNQIKELWRQLKASKKELLDNPDD